MRRRAFITLVGGAAAAWPLAARAQQRAGVPVIGFLDNRPPEAMSDRLRAFGTGLKETNFVEGENVTVLYRFGPIERLPELAAELVRRPVALIVASSGAAALAAKAATATIPIAFLAGVDPAKLGLVSSLARPGANLTGVNLFTGELAAKRLELLRELVPQAARVAVLVNPADVAATESTLKDAQAAAGTMGLQIRVLNANTSREIDATFEAIARERPDGLFVGSSPFLTGRRVQLVQLAAFDRVPATYSLREFAEIGGLTSYGPHIGEAYRQIGVYAGRILKGVKPSELPVEQATKFELVINADTARMLGLAVPATLLATADEVIE